jgi:hypothetical protein
MSYMRTGILGAIAVSASFGAVQLASGHDLDFTIGLRAFAAIPAEGVTPAEVVNRTAKADRVAGAVAPAETMQTISIHVDRVADSSVLVRIPRQQQARRTAPAAPRLIQSEERKATLACEPMVSVLTEIAKRLQPGRCVT